MRVALHCAGWALRFFAKPLLETRPVKDCMMTIDPALIDAPFRKMNGLGNDFVIIDARTKSVQIDDETARRITDRRRGVGCDQLIILESSGRADVFMRILNNDGSEVEACGNAARCVGRLMLDETGKQGTTIETRTDLLVARDSETSQGGNMRAVSVDMGVPRFGWKDIPLLSEALDTRAVSIDVAALEAGLPHHFAAVNVGNPHAIFWVEDVDAHAIERTGPLLEVHPLFPEKVNVSFVKVVSRQHLVQRVWERGAGLTLACGTGACAAAVAAMRAGFVERKVKVTLPGGDLLITWQDDDRIVMSGPVSMAFEGRLSPALFGA
jgi:diaminopimelate epimerase